jgi:hypothetical protein
MKRRTFSLLEMMLAIVIVGESVELSKMIYEARTVLLEATCPTQMDVWRHLCVGPSAVTPIAPVANAAVP